MHVIWVIRNSSGNILCCWEATTNFSTDEKKSPYETSQLPSGQFLSRINEPADFGTLKSGAGSEGVCLAEKIRISRDVDLESSPTLPPELEGLTYEFKDLKEKT